MSTEATQSETVEINTDLDDLNPNNLLHRVSVLPIYQTSLARALYRIPITSEDQKAAFYVLRSAVNEIDEVYQLSILRANELEMEYILQSFEKAFGRSYITSLYDEEVGVLMFVWDAREVRMHMAKKGFLPTFGKKYH